MKPTMGLGRLIALIALQLVLLGVIFTRHAVLEREAIRVRLEFAGLHTDRDLAGGYAQPYIRFAGTFAEADSVRRKGSNCWIILAPQGAEQPWRVARVLPRGPESEPPTLVEGEVALAGDGGAYHLNASGSHRLRLDDQEQKEIDEELTQFQRKEIARYDSLSAAFAKAGPDSTHRLLAAAEYRQPRGAVDALVRKGAILSLRSMELFGRRYGR